MSFYAKYFSRHSLLQSVDCELFVDCCAIWIDLISFNSFHLIHITHFSLAASAVDGSSEISFHFPFDISFSSFRFVLFFYSHLGVCFVWTRYLNWITDSCCVTPRYSGQKKHEDFDYCFCLPCKMSDYESVDHILKLQSDQAKIIWQQADNRTNETLRIYLYCAVMYFIWHLEDA